jgi:HK97 family phage major capsid protein
MNEKELEKLVNDKVDASLEAKTAAIIKGVADPYIKDQLKEQLDTAIKGVKDQLGPAPDVKEAEEKAKKFQNGRDFLYSVYKARTVPGYKDDRLAWLPSIGTKTAGHMEIGDDAQGGFLVPEVYRAELYEIAIENAIVRPYATVLPMTTDSLKIPYVNDTSHVTSVYGGVIAYWTAEAAAKTASKPTFGQMELIPHKLAGLTYTSNELLADSAIALEPLIRRQFGTAWGFFEDHAFLAGVGGGQPLGILNCGCLKSVFRNTTSHVYIEDIAEMYQSMLPSSLGSAY